MIVDCFMLVTGVNLHFIYMMANVGVEDLSPQVPK